MNYLYAVKHNWYKYLALITVFVILVGGIHLLSISQSTTTRVVLFSVAFWILLVTYAIGWLIFASTIKHALMLHHTLHKYTRQCKCRLTLILDLNRILRHQYYNHSVDIVFAMFVHFYEQHLQDVEHWALPEEEFPEGKFALTKMYKYIKKIRVDNQKELAGMDFNDKDNTFSFWGEWYGGFNYKLKEDELVVTPNSDITTPDTFFKKRMRIENELYTLDNEKANWIINRRKFLMI